MSKFPCLAAACVPLLLTHAAQTDERNRNEQRDYVKLET